MPYRTTGPRLAVALVALATVAACSHGTRGRTANQSVSDGTAVQGRCLATEMLVVENRSGYPVKVIATDASPNGFATGSALITTVASGVVDTIPWIGKVHPYIQLEVDRPAFSPNGVKPVSSGYGARCVTRS